MRVVRVAVASVALLAGSAGLAAGQTANSRVFDPEEDSPYAPQVDLWLEEVSFRYGELIRPHFAAEPGAYVTIVRVTTDGSLHVLYPRSPSSQRQYQIGQLSNDRVPHNFNRSFHAFESSGTGFVIAIASYDRFDYRYYTRGTSGQAWRTQGFGAGSGRYADAFEIVRRFVDRTLSDRSEYSLDYVAYEVYSTGTRSRYASQYGAYSFDDHYDLCLNAFGYRYNSYCGAYNGYYNGYYGRYYGPIIIAGPRKPRPGNASKPREPRIRPLVPDPMVPTRPVDPSVAQGRFPARDKTEAAYAARRERMLRSASPRINPRTNPSAIQSRVGSESRTMTRQKEPVVYRSAPRSEPRPQAQPRRFEPRQQPQARVETRSEPREQSKARSEPRSERSRPNN